MPKSTRTAQTRLTAFGEVVLSFPFSAAMVDDLKQAVPYGFMSYDEATKTWTVKPSYVDLAIELLLEHFPDPEVPRRVRKTYSRADSRTSGNTHFATLHL